MLLKVNESEKVPQQSYRPGKVLDFWGWGKKALIRKYKIILLLIIKDTIKKKGAGKENWWIVNSLQEVMIDAEVRGQNAP